MKNKKGINGIADTVMKFGKNLVASVKKADKRILLMIVAAAVLVIIILALIIRGVTANKEEIPSANENPSNTGVISELGTGDLAANTAKPALGGIGRYTVDTNSESTLNMRIAADRTSEVLATIPNNTLVEVLFVDDSEAASPDSYGWGYIEYNGKRGWVYMEYLKAE